MNRSLRHLIPLPALAGMVLWGTAAMAQPNELFQKAGRAYDAGHFAEASRGYTALIEQGQHRPEVYFNLGNAEFRAGHDGAAVLAYRQAWRLTPRDADIAANLQFALEHTGAALPAPPPWERLLQSLSAAEWRLAALASFWCLAGAACCALWLPAGRKATRPLVVLLFVAVLLTLSGVWYWFDLEIRRPEAVVIQPAKVLFAPLPNATEYFALPAGSLLRLEARDGDWWRIRQGARSGWLPLTNCAPVYAAPAR